MGKGKIMKKYNMAILVIGFDGYNDLWDDFFTLFHKYWIDCPYKTYFVNNDLEYNIMGVTTIHAGIDAEWSRKAQKALELIKEDYVCLLLEDFYLGKKVDTNVIEHALKIIQKENIQYYKLNTFTPFRTKIYKQYKHLHIIPENMEYGISLLPGIWRKEFLSKKLGSDNYNAWQFEYNQIIETRGKSDNPIKGCVFDERNILRIVHGVVQGKYLPEVLRYFKKEGYRLNQNKRGAMSFKENFIYKCKRLNWPQPVRPFLKKILRIFGMTFVTDQNNKIS